MHEAFQYIKENGIDNIFLMGFRRNTSGQDLLYLVYHELYVYSNEKAFNIFAEDRKTISVAEIDLNYCTNHDDTEFQSVYERLFQTSAPVLVKDIFIRDDEFITLFIRYSAIGNNDQYLIAELASFYGFSFKNETIA